MDGYIDLAPPERAWAQRLAEQGRLTILIQTGATDQGVVDNDGAPHPADVIRALLAGGPAPAIASAPPTPYAQFLDTVFAPRTLAGDVSEEQLFAVRARRKYGVEKLRIWGRRRASDGRRRPSRE